MDELHELLYADSGLKAFGRIDNGELNELYSPNIRVNKERKITQAGYLARMGVKTNTYRVLVRKL